MVYFVETVDRTFRIDYPCYGLLSEMHTLGNIMWRGNIFTENGDRAEHSCDYVPLPGLTPATVVAVYTPVEQHAPHECLEHPLFSGIELVDYADQGLCFKLVMETVPCDQLFIPLFALRNIFCDDHNQTHYQLYQDLVNKGYSDAHSVILANCWYSSSRMSRSTRKFETVYYSSQEDGSVFHYGRIGDLVSILQGTLPNYMSSLWGSLNFGYPVEGGAYQEHEEPINPYTGSSHHMNYCVILKPQYEGFFDRALDCETALSKEELFTLIEEIMSHV